MGKLEIIDLTDTPPPSPPQTPSSPPPVVTAERRGALLFDDDAAAGAWRAAFIARAADVHAALVDAGLDAATRAVDAPGRHDRAAWERAAAAAGASVARDSRRGTLAICKPAGALTVSRRRMHVALRAIAREVVEEAARRRGHAAEPTEKQCEREREREQEREELGEKNRQKERERRREQERKREHQRQLERQCDRERERQRELQRELQRDQQRGLQQSERLLERRYGQERMAEQRQQHRNHTTSPQQTQGAAEAPCRRGGSGYSSVDETSNVLVPTSR